MQFPNDDTGRVLAEMQAAGIDLNIEHKVEFFQLFELKEQAEKMAAYLQTLDFIESVKLHPDASPNVWDVDCVIKMVPSHEQICKYERKLEKIADQYDGYNDGWGIEA